jgi:crossover junction endodeoxyribonuclease RuvC
MVATSSPPRRILGIDPGLNRTGFGVIDCEGSQLRFVDAGVIRVPAGELAGRLLVILRGLGEVIAHHQPREAVVEKVFVNVNPQSTLLLGQARGAALCAAVGAGLSVVEYTALQVKQATSGYGHADKTQIQHMVKRLLDLSKAPASDAADALACAICHAHATQGLGAHLVHTAPRRARGTRGAWAQVAEQRQAQPAPMATRRGAGR